MALLVLLTACANVSQLILSRATERSRELAVWAALGASRARLLQQLVTEAVLFTTASTALGLALSQWICRLAAAIVPPEIATQEFTIFDWRVLAFATGLAVFTAVVFGLSSAHLTERLQPGGEFATHAAIGAGCRYGTSKRRFNCDPSGYYIVFGDEFVCVGKCVFEVARH